MPPTSRDVDNPTYNTQAEVGVDSAAFDPDADNSAVGARGSNQPTARNFEREDMETERSDQTGKIPRGILFHPSFGTWLYHSFRRGR